MDVVIRKVGDGAIILCFCKTCKGTSPLVLSDLNVVPRNVCINAKRKIQEYTQESK
jgi:hypothetical protein